MMTPEGRLRALRQEMHRLGLDAYIVYGTDPHQSEYVPAHWQHRHWLTGFHGSAGTALVTQTEAALWTDSRYYLEAEEALSGTPFRLQRSDEPQTPGIPAYLRERLGAGARVGSAAATLSLSRYRSLRGELEPRGIVMEPCGDLVAAIRDERPAPPSAPVYAFSAERAGLTRADKLARLRDELTQIGADALLLTALDEIAWLLNLRGADVPYNPVALAYLILEPHGAQLFIDPQKVPAEIAEALRADGVSCRGYDELETALCEPAPTERHAPQSHPTERHAPPIHSAQTGPAGANPALDAGDNAADGAVDSAASTAGGRGAGGVVVAASPDQITMQFVQALPGGVHLLEQPSPVARLKAVKNPRELTQLRACMVKDGAVMASFLFWVTTAHESEPASELSAAAYLRELRAAQPEFVDESFAAISAFGPHGAIVHYSASEASDLALEPDGLYLVDSGGQYLDGTTDITRTVAIGEPSERMRTEYTTVLQAHIALAGLSFPYGTTGTQLDAVTRAVLWRRHRNYGHGTGHGVGFFLNVHEGPQRLSPRYNGVALEPGMVVSNEPGLYRAGAYGIRLENLVTVRADRENVFGSFLCFETLTLCPFDRRLIDPAMLSAEERGWLNRYHRRVYDELHTHLSPPARVWLTEQTAAL